MGFLNHATNNIIIDAVLTERGRELLSKNNGSFSIEAFSFGDDEIDYSLLTKYGLTIGKEKIIKNTPVFEANPNENIAIKHPIISFPNPLTRINELPKLVRDDGLTTAITLTNSDDAQDSEVTVKIKNFLTTIDANSTLNPNITDDIFIIKLHGALLDITGNTSATFIDTDLNGIKTYEVSTANETNGAWLNQKSAEFTIKSYGVVTSNSFAKFSTIGNANRINTSIQVIGESSGASIVIPIQISQPNT